MGDCRASWKLFRLVIRRLQDFAAIWILDFADDVSLLAELLELVVPILETIASEAASLGFEVNWQKTKVQALGCREDMPLKINVQGQDVMVVEEFVYLGSLIHSSTGSTCDISCQSAITRTAMQSLENQI